MRAQAERFGAELVADDVTRVDFSERRFRVDVGDEEYRATLGDRRDGRDRAPARPARARSTLQGHGRRLLRRLRRRLLPRQDVVVVGGGDTAMEEATFLAKFATRSPWCTAATSSAPRKIMVDRARAKDQHRLRHERRRRRGARHRPRPGQGREADRHASPARTREIEADGLFVAIGHDPTTTLFSGVARHGRGRVPDDTRRLDRAPTSRACSPPATSSTTCTARP